MTSMAAWSGCPRTLYRTILLNRGEVGRCPWAISYCRADELAGRYIRLEAGQNGTSQRSCLLQEGRGTKHFGHAVSPNIKVTMLR